MFELERCIFIAALLLYGCVVITAPVQARGQQPSRDTASAQGSGKSDFSELLATARRSLSEGRFEEAVRTADAVLARDVVNRSAVEIKTAALLQQQQFDNALTAYDRFTTAIGGTDPALLAIIARAELARAVQRQPNDGVRTAAALERLARAGDDSAVQSLKTAASSWPPFSREQLALIVSLARLGDEEAASRLGEMLDSATAWEQKTAVISALKDGDVRSQAPRIAAQLDSPEPQVQCAAALAVGVLQFKEAIPKLQALFESEVQIVKLYAAVALKRLGQTSADVFLANAFASDLPQIRLTVAEAYQSGRSTQWMERVRQLLDDRNELARLQAAELLAGADAAVARPVLVSALNSPNPLLRGEAARILEAKNLLDVTLARRLLGDSYEAARLYGAGAALRAAGSSSRPR